MKAENPIPGFLLAMALGVVGLLVGVATMLALAWFTKGGR